MDQKDFLAEIEKITEDIGDFSRPYSPCEYFHGREKLFNRDQFEEVVKLFLEIQQKKFEGKP